MPETQSQTLGSMSQSQTAPSPAPSPEVDGKLFAGYRSPGQSFDEFRDSSQSPRPSWQGLHERLVELGPNGLSQSWRRGEELLRENGISYNLLSEQSGSERPWNLDPIPALLSEN